MKPPPMPVRTIRVDDKTWDAAQAAAERRGERLPDAIRRALKAYAARTKTEADRTFRRAK